MRKLAGLLVLVVALLLASCSNPLSQAPYGTWSGNAYVNGRYAGAIAANYESRTWAWCLQSFDCIVGYTRGWDLVDSVGEVARGTYNGSTVSIRYSYLGDVLTATLRPYSSRSAALETFDAPSGSLREALEGL